MSSNICFRYTRPFRMLLELRGIQKRFGGVQALSDGNLSVAAGEAHLLLGENGAGKSTLMKIVAGMYERDAGQMLWDGREVRLSTPAHAAAIGIAMVHQESLLAPHLSVAENIFLGREARKPFGWVDRGDMIARARRLIEEHHFPLQAEWRAEKLSPAAKQLLSSIPSRSPGVARLSWVASVFRGVGRPLPIAFQTIRAGARSKVLLGQLTYDVSSSQHPAYVIMVSRILTVSGSSTVNNDYSGLPLGSRIKVTGVIESAQRYDSSWTTPFLCFRLAGD